MKRLSLSLLILTWLLGMVSNNYATSPKAKPLNDPPPRPNIVIIFVDDMGYGDLVANLPAGTVPDFETPNLNAMAQDGMRFTHFYSASAVCTPARAALLTGSYPTRVGLPGVLRPEATIGLNPDETTLAELVKQEGYATGAFGKWHVGHDPEFLPLNQGFDRFYGLPYSNDQWPRDRFGNLVTTGAKADNPELPLISDNTVIDEITSLEKQDSLTYKYTVEAVNFINTQADAGNPFFVYLPHSMPHVPLAARDEFKTNLADRYKDVMEELDWSVGEVMAALEAKGIEDNTWVIFTSDNGPWLRYGNHGGSSGEFREGKGSAFEGGFRVPCLMKWPNVIPAGRVNARVASTLDIFPTVANATGASLPNPNTHPIDGVDITPLLENGFAGGRIRNDFFYYKGRELAAVRAGIWKYVFPYTYTDVVSPGVNGSQGTAGDAFFEGALYNLIQDPGETNDLQDVNPAKVAELKALAEAMAQKIGNIGGANESFRERDIAQFTGSEKREPGRVSPNAQPGGLLKNDVFYDEGSAVKIEQLIGDFDKSRLSPTRNQTESRFGLEKTDLGVPMQFEDSDTTFIFFGDDLGAGRGARDPIGFTTDTNPEDGLDLQFISNPDGNYRPLDIPGVDLSGFGVPQDGVTKDGTIYLYTAQVEDTSSQLSKSTDKGRTWQKLYDFSEDRFNNINVVKTVADANFPETTGTEIQLLFGSGAYRGSNVSLAYQPIASIEDKSTVRFLSGYDFLDKPIWSSQEADAIDLFNQRCVGELSVAYNEFIGKWIMLYNCGNNPGPRGINARTAENPWGPWSEPFVIFNDRRDNGYCNFMHSNWQVEVCDSIHDAGRQNIWAGSYGPYQFDRLATGNDLETTIYYTMSTWNPYTVLLMKSTLVKDTTSNIPASGININLAQATIEFNKGRRLAVTVSPKNAADRSVVWSTSDASIVTVGPEGFINGVGVGTAVVTATTHNGLQDSTTVVVSARPPVSATIPPGLYTFRAQHSNRALDNSGFNGAGTGNNNVVQFDFNNLLFQKWQLDTLDGGYYRITSLASGQVLSLVPQGPGNGRNVNQEPWANIDRQKWQITQLSDGNYRLISKFSGRTLEVNGTNNNGSNVQQWDWLNFAHQKWDIQPTSVVAVSGISLNVSTLDLEIDQDRRLTRSITPANASTRSVRWSSSDTAVAKVNRNGFVTSNGIGTATISVTTDDGNFTATATVTVSPLPALTTPFEFGVYTFAAQHDNRLMDNRGFPDETISQNVDLAEANGTSTQQWQLEVVDGSYYRITSVKSGLVLNLDSAADGSRVIRSINQAPWANKDLQKWQIADLGNGVYRIINKQTLRSVEVDVTEFFVDNNIQQAIWADVDHQKWSITPVPIANLNLTSMCSDDPATERRWRIRNPNPFGVEVWWHVYGTSQRDTLIAPPGDSFFFTQTVGGANTTKLYHRRTDGSVRTVTKASGGAACSNSNGRIGATEEDADVTATVSIFPNPWGEEDLRIIADDTISELRIYDIAGGLVYHLQPESVSAQIPRSIIRARGLLLVQITTLSGVATERIMLK